MENNKEMRDTTERGILFIYIRLLYCLKNNIPMSPEEIKMIGEISSAINKQSTILKD